MAQPQPNKSATHAGKGKPAPRNAREAMPPGGPIKPSPMGPHNPGPTPNLRGVEPNTGRDKGQPNPPQRGTAGHHGDHAPGQADAGNTHGHGVPAPIVGNRGAKKHHSAPLRGVAPGDHVPKGADR